MKKLFQNLKYSSVKQEGYSILIHKSSKVLNNRETNDYLHAAKQGNRSALEYYEQHIII